MIGQNQMGPLADREILADLNALGLKSIHLRDQRFRIDHHPVTDDAQRASVQDTGGNQMKDKRVPLVDDGMAGIGSALVSHHYIGVAGQDVHDLALASSPHWVPTTTRLPIPVTDS